MPETDLSPINNITHIPVTLVGTLLSLCFQKAYLLTNELGVSMDC